MSELALWLKYAPGITPLDVQLLGMFIVPFPTSVVIAWIIVGAVFLGIVVFLLIRDLKRKQPPFLGRVFNPYNPPVDIEYVK